MEFLKARFIALCVLGSILYAGGENIALAKEEVIADLSRSDSIPKESVDGKPDPYFEGYIQALVDMHFYEYGVVVLVKDHEVCLGNLPKNELTARSIIAFVKDVPGVKVVRICNGISSKEMAKREEYVHHPKVSGVWFPQSTELFYPMIANPRQVTYSIGYRGGDHVVGKKAVAVSLGDDFPIFRWLNVWRWCGDLQIGIEAGIWSVFNMDVKGYNPNGGTALVNTDFYVGVPLSYAVDKWAFRLRGYHISSHLGDEFMVNHPGFKRKNPSFEAIDFFASYQGGEVFRLYGGAGIIIHSDESFPMKRLYIEYGTELRWGGHKIYYHGLYGNCVFAAHIRNWQLNHWNFDETALFGYEWSKLQGIGRKIRLFTEFHNGFSCEGQFMKKRTTYGTVTFAYGF